MALEIFRLFRTMIVNLDVLCLNWGFAFYKHTPIISEGKYFTNLGHYIKVTTFLNPSILWLLLTPFQIPEWFIFRTLPPPPPPEKDKHTQSHNSPGQCNMQIWTGKLFCTFSYKNYTKRMISFYKIKETKYHMRTWIFLVRRESPMYHIRLSLVFLLSCKMTKMYIKLYCTNPANNVKKCTVGRPGHLWGISGDYLITFNQLWQNMRLMGLLTYREIGVESQWWCQIFVIWNKEQSANTQMYHSVLVWKGHKNFQAFAWFQTLFVVWI